MCNTRRKDLSLSYTVKKIFSEDKLNDQKNYNSNVGRRVCCQRINIRMGNRQGNKPCRFNNKFNKGVSMRIAGIKNGKNSLIGIKQGNLIIRQFTYYKNNKVKNVICAIRRKVWI